MYLHVFLKINTISTLCLPDELSDQHVTPIAMVFDELKDYLSESDLSLDYKISRSRSRKKKHQLLTSNRNSRLFHSDASQRSEHQGISLIN